MYTLRALSGQILHCVLLADPSLTESAQTSPRPSRSNQVRGHFTFGMCLDACWIALIFTHPRYKDSRSYSLRPPSAACWDDTLAEEFVNGISLMLQTLEAPTDAGTKEITLRITVPPERLEVFQRSFARIAALPA